MLPPSSYHFFTDYTAGGLRQIDSWDLMDLTAGAAGLGAAIFFASNPIGWAIGGAVTIYFAFILVDELTQGG